MIISASTLMQTNHPIYPYFNSSRPIPEKYLPGFFDYCSKALNEFLGILHYCIEPNMGETEMFTIMDDMIDTFQQLMDIDEPDEFFRLKRHFEDEVLPSFQELMNHLSRCIDKPESLKQFYRRLSSKVIQTYEFYILGSE